MATIKEIKKRRKTGATAMAKKVKKKKNNMATVMSVDQMTKTREEVTPISKYKEWKLLYTPYPFKTSGDNISPMTNSQVRIRIREEESNKYKGLCKNCKKQETCRLPKPEGGVWRCEEYE